MKLLILRRVFHHRFDTGFGVAAMPGKAGTVTLRAETTEVDVVNVDTHALPDLFGIVKDTFVIPVLTPIGTDGVLFCIFWQFVELIQGLFDHYGSHLNFSFSTDSRFSRESLSNVFSDAV